MFKLYPNLKVFEFCFSNKTLAKRFKVFMIRSFSVPQKIVVIKIGILPSLWVKILYFVDQNSHCQSVDPQIFTLPKWDFQVFFNCSGKYRVEWSQAIFKIFLFWEFLIVAWEQRTFDPPEHCTVLLFRLSFEIKVNGNTPFINYELPLSVHLTINLNI